MFLASEPIVWIPAKTFFRFSSRRFIELHDLQCKLALQRPDNYGTLSAFVLHLMRAVMVTPSKIPSYVRSMLQILHEKRVMERFGMFFVDDLDLEDMERINVNLGVQDGDEIKRDQRAALATRLLPKKGQQRGIQLTESHRTEDYPWGETISWKTLQGLLKDDTMNFLQPFNFHQLEMDFGNLHWHLVESLFNDFTRDTWLGLHESFVPAGVRPCSTSLKDSMEVWTCQNITARLGGKCIFYPSTYGIGGSSKSKDSDLSFKSLRPLFFPDPGQSIKEKTFWDGCSEKNGYIRRYWEILEDLKDESINALHDGIDQVFEQLQCLPQSKANSNLWHATGGSVCFLANPHYYRIKAVSTTARNLTKGPQRPQVGIAELRKRLDPYNPESKKRKRNLNKKKSTSVKHKKFRNPPKKRQKMGMDKPLKTRTKPTTTAARSTRGNAQHALDGGLRLEPETTSSEMGSSSACETDSSNSTMSSEW
jgi:hypothetical protein